MLTEPAAPPLPNLNCPLCGGANACSPAQSGSFDTPCWCQQVKVSPWARAQVALKDPQGLSCLCPRCARLEAPADNATASTPPTPQPGPQR
ncbi:MAG TPA: cysteine-rich CWC family protein [Candidatus Aquabacterium excrementipullorum]|nr:cysteine-rich CWC family protein [Candidatus Aquabacterium excrementipullorum]